MGWVNVTASIASDQMFHLQGKTSKVTISRTDLNSNPKPGKGKWSLFEVKQPDQAMMPADFPKVAKGLLKENKDFQKIAKYQTPGDQLRARWESSNFNNNYAIEGWEKAKKVISGEVKHDKEGKAEITLPTNLKSGVYRIFYETKDDFGETYKTHKNFIVANLGGSTHLQLPLQVLPQKYSYTIGEKARFLIHSSFPDQRLNIEVFRAGTRIRKLTMTTGKSGSILEIPITEKDRGGFSVSASMLRDYQHLYKNQAVMVPWNNKKLQLEFSRIRDKIRPGQNEDWTVTIKQLDKKGQPQALRKATEVLAYMYDRSLEAFASHSPPSPTNIFSVANYETPSQSSVLNAEAV